MPLTRYGVLVGCVVDRRSEGVTPTPHCQSTCDADDVDFCVAVNVLSKQHLRAALHRRRGVLSPTLRRVAQLPDGFNFAAKLAWWGRAGFHPGDLFDRQGMRSVPSTVPAPDNDLANLLDHFVERAAADPAAKLC
jgi:uncharacterized protein YukJ